MEKKRTTDKSMNQREEERTKSSEHSSVEFLPGENQIPYHFKLKDFSSKGFGILVRKDSKLLQFIKIGDILNMKYHPEMVTVTPKTYQTQIKHISEPEPGKHKDHIVVGLMIVT